MDEEQDDFDSACWAQQEQEERARLEAALAHHRELLKASRAELEGFIRNNAAFHKRTSTPTRLEH